MKPKRERKRPRIKPEEVEKIMALYISGTHIDLIAQAVERSKTTIYTVIKQNKGIKVMPSREKKDPRFDLDLTPRSE